MSPVTHEPRRRRWPFVLLALLLLFGVAAALAFDPLLRSLIKRRAHERGVQIEFREWELSRSELVLRDAKLELRGVVGVAATLERLTVNHQRGVPTRLAARGVELDVEGGAMLLLLDLAGWTSKFPENFGLPARAEDFSLRWRSGGREWLALDDSEIAPKGDGIALEAGRARVFGVALGKVGARWHEDQSTVDLGFGRSDLDAAPVHLEVKHASSSPSAVIELRPVPLDQLAGPLGVELPIDGVVASGRAEIQLSAWGLGPISGTLHAVLDGYAPPAPPELGGIVFGKTTVLDSELELDSSHRLLTLSKLRVKHGALKLSGKGNVRREADHATIGMKLRGNLRCSELAAAAARVRLGALLGGPLGQLAAAAIKGSVAVILDIDADTRDLAAARMKRTIGIGCGLTPLVLPDIADLPIPPAIASALPSGFPSALPTFPLLPSARPRLPELPLPGLPTLRKKKVVEEKRARDDEP